MGTRDKKPKNRPRPEAQRAATRRRLQASGVGAIGVVGIVGISVGLWRWADSGREDFAQWLMAVATVATLFAAVAAAMFAAGAYRLEVQREGRYNDDRRRTQAERFSGWCGEEDTTVTMTSGSGRAFDWGGGTADVVYLRNASDLPVNRVHVVVRTLAGTALGGADVGVVPPSDEPQIIYLDSETRRSIAEVKREYREQTALETQKTVVLPPGFGLQVELWFTDAAGVVWHRADDGRLEERALAP